jgi:hypothetical protein
MGEVEEAQDGEGGDGGGAVDERFKVLLDLPD